MKKKRTAFSQRFLLIFSSTLFLSAFLLFNTVSGLTRETVLVESNDSMLFVGDVLLGRHVERLMNEHGDRYPFHRISELLDSHDDVIGNFEASIPEQHRPTPAFDFTFSVETQFAELLRTEGFTGVSLANNHARDHGVGGFHHTEISLRDAGILTTGDPQSVDVHDVQWYELSGKSIALIPLNLTWGDQLAEAIIQVLSQTVPQSDHTIVYVHWGNEYEETASSMQTEFAHTLIDHGADVIIGHHPHVVQNIEAYNDGLIFYSLGNFIFDQYWDISVQEGLTLSVRYTDERYGYTLIPVTSHDKRSAPRVMKSAEARSFLRDLADRSDERLQGSITRGSISHYAKIQ